MKSLVTAIVLFVSVLILVSVDKVMIDNLIDDIKKELQYIPNTVSELEALDDGEKQEIEKSLVKAEKMWDEKDTFLYLSLKHNTAREFTEHLIPAICYFKANDFSEFIALFSLAADTLEHISFDENIKLGNLF